MDAGDIEQRRALAARREELEAKMFALGRRSPRPEEMAEHNRTVAAVLQELASLPRPESGEAYGCVMIGGFLGAPWSPPPRVEDDDWKADPTLRFERECGRGDPR